MLSLVVGLVLLALAIVPLVARHLPIPGHQTLAVVVFAPYLIPAAPLAALVLAWGHRWLLTSAAALLTVALIAPQLRWYVATRPNPDGIALRMMSINMLYGRADPAPIVALAAEAADVVLVQELTPEAVNALAAAGFDAKFPHRAIDARPKADGVGLWSRHPITADWRVEGFTLAMVAARINLGGVAADPTVVSVHLDAPWPAPIDGWHRDVARFPATQADLADRARGGAVIFGGDFNSTTDMRAFRALLTGGYADSADQAGAGRVRTYPANKGRIPTFMGIDHMLIKGATATSTTTVILPETDHRALLATLIVPRG